MFFLENDQLHIGFAESHVKPGRHADAGSNFEVESSKNILDGLESSLALCGGMSRAYVLGPLMMWPKTCRWKS